MNSFLGHVKKLLCWGKTQNDLTSPFADDTERMFATLFSIIEYSSIGQSEKDHALSELRDFATSFDITPLRQHELVRKVQLVHWNAKETIREYGVNGFIEDFVAICLQDKKIQPTEYKLLYLIGKYLNLSKEQISGMLRSRLSKFRYRAILFFERPIVSAGITVLIILNALQLGLLTCNWFTPYLGPLYYSIDLAFLTLFSIEILCRIFAFRRDFFREPQNWFDFIIILVSWIPLPGFRLFKATRVLRAMLLLNRLEQLKQIIKSLLDALPNIAWVSILLLIFYYVFAVAATTIFGSDFPAFSSIPKSLFSLFQLMTLEGWPDLVSSVMVKFPYAWLLFIPFMITTSYIFLNLVIGIIVTAMQDISLKKNTTVKKEIDEIRDLREDVALLSEQVFELKKMLNKSSPKDKDIEDKGKVVMPPIFQGRHYVEADKK